MRRRARPLPGSGRCRDGVAGRRAFRARSSGRPRRPPRRGLRSILPARCREAPAGSAHQV